MTMICNYCKKYIPFGDEIYCYETGKFYCSGMCKEKDLKIFLSLCKDLVSACMQADNTEGRNIPADVAYFYWEAPNACWGSKEKMDEWIKSKKSIKEANHETVGTETLKL